MTEDCSIATLPRGEGYCIKFKGGKRSPALKYVRKVAHSIDMVDPEIYTIKGTDKQVLIIGNGIKIKSFRVFNNRREAIEYITKTKRQFGEEVLAERLKTGMYGSENANLLFE